MGAGHGQRIQQLTARSASGQGTAHFPECFFLKTPIAATPSTEDRNSLGPGAIPSPLSTCRPIPLAIYGALNPVFNEPLSELLDFGFALGVEEVLAEGNDCHKNGHSALATTHYNTLYSKHQHTIYSI